MGFKLLMHVGFVETVIMNREICEDLSNSTYSGELKTLSAFFITNRNYIIMYFFYNNYALPKIRMGKVLVENK